MTVFRKLFNYFTILKIKCNNLKSISKLDVLCVNCPESTNKFREKKFTYKYLTYLASGYITYKLCKNYFFPTVSAFSSENRRTRFNFIADVVQTSAHAVVYIEVKDSRRIEFFTGKPITISNGSGFIVQEDGLILTNAHVVTIKPHAKLEIRLYDGSIYNGIIEDIDIKSDLATVRIQAQRLSTIKLGDSSTLRAGEFVIAMGSPLTLSNTVTFGVISSTHRDSEELGLYGKDMVYLQTDAPITFGNSGGPLINLDGEAIGINSMKVSDGISFAIPSDYVKKFLKNAQGANKFMKGVPRKRYMGITMITLTPSLMRELQQRNQTIPLDVKSGVLVWKVIIGSPAHTGGLQPGDIVTHIDNKPITSANDVHAILLETKVRTVKMAVNRSGRKLDINVTPEDI